MKKKKLITDFLEYSALNIIGMIGLSCYILADTFFVSKGIGANGLAALNIAIPAYSFMHGCGLMTAMGGATRYTLAKSQKNISQANIIFSHTFIIASILALIFMMTGIFLSRPITTLLKADSDIFEMTNTYIKVLLTFSPAFIMNDIMVCFVRNDGDPKLSMTAMVTGSLANILLDYIFIFPLNMGIFGAVLATGFSPLISMCILSSHIIKKKNSFHFTKVKAEPSLDFRIISIGFPSLISELSSGIVIIIFNMIILNLQGNIGVAAYGVIANISLVVMSIFTGIAQGIQPLISKFHGHGEYQNVKIILRYALITMSIISVMIYSAVFLFADGITEIFNSEHNQELQRIAVSGIKIYFTAVIFAGFNIIISIYFTSSGKSFPAFIISLSRGLFLIIPITYLLSILLKINGVWLAFPVTEGITSMIGVIMYIKKPLIKYQKQIKKMFS